MSAGVRWVDAPRERSQHIAIAPGEPDTNERLVVCVEHGAMQQWLARSTAMGLVPDDVVPAPLLLPLPDDADTLAVTLAEGFSAGEKAAKAAGAASPTCSSKSARRLRRRF